MWLVFVNHRMTARHHADASGISNGSANTVESIFDLRYFRLVPKQLNFLEKERHIRICKVLLFGYHPVKKWIITGDQTLKYAL